MRKLDAVQLRALGAPAGGGALQIEEWLRDLLRGGGLRLPEGLVELRGPQPVVTTLGDLKNACGVAVETVKQGLRTLEMEHWVMLVDGAHTRLLGPPRFRVSISKENLWGSVGGAVEISAVEGMNPLESIDYERLASPSNVQDRKQTLVVEPLELAWRTRTRLSNGREFSLESGTEFSLASGSFVRVDCGHSGMIARDLRVAALGGRELRLLEFTELRVGKGPPLPLPSGSLLELERSNLIRLPSGETGILSIESQAKAGETGVIDWSVDSHWLGRFRRSCPLVLFRRAIYASLDEVVMHGELNRGEDQSRWNVILGVHDCVLDGSIPFHAGRCSVEESPECLVSFLRSMGERDSLRARMQAEFGVQVGAADVRLSATASAPAYDRKNLRQVATNRRLNSEILSVGNKTACWNQVGAYFRAGELFPWEVTRELYFTHVALHYRQSA